MRSARIATKTIVAYSWHRRFAWVGHPKILLPGTETNVRSWVKQAEIDQGRATQRLTTDERAELVVGSSIDLAFLSSCPATRIPPLQGQ